MIRYISMIVAAIALSVVPAVALAQGHPPALPRLKASDGVGMRTMAVQCVDDTGSLVPCSVVRVPSNATPGSITAANIFQSVLPANPQRTGCVIYNKSAEVMLVFLGPIANATAAAAIPVRAGGSLMCGSPQGVVITDELSITGPTVGDAYLVVSQ